MARSSSSRTTLLFILFCIFIYFLLARKTEYSFGSRGGKVDYTSSNIKGFARIYSENCNQGVAQYAIVLDAGSTGSRIHVYRFNYCKGKGVPVLEDEVFVTIKPGLSSFTQDMDGAVESISVLMKAALKSVPKEFYSCTPVTLKATAGLRMLSDGMGEKILSRVATSLETDFPFPIFHEEGVAIMGGDQEGVFAWITLNYLLGRIGSSSTTRLDTAGIMDLGGGSTQIVFEEPDVERGDHRVELEFSGHTYVLYQHSYDGYGLMQARKSINEASSKSKSGAVCLPQHHQLEFSNDNGDQISLQGAATNFEECQQLISTKVFAKDKVWCAQAPCSFDGVYMPPLGDHHELYAFSYFYDKFSEPFEVGDSFYVGQIKAAAQDVCSNKITEKSLGSEGKKEIKKNREWCSDLGYMYSLLSVGYSLPDTRRVSIAKKVNGIEIGWSLGAAIKMLEKTKKCTLSSRF